jgi:hypothetical protein
VSVLEEAARCVRGLGEMLWAARPPAELLETVRAVERLRSVLDAVELTVMVEVEATGAARTEGWASTRDYLTAVAGGRKGEGRRMLRLAMALSGDRRATGAALTAGALSRTQAEVIVGVLDRLPGSRELRDAAEALLLEQARTQDAGDLQALGPYLLERLDPEGSERRDETALQREERAAHSGRFLSVTDDGIGGVRVRGRGTVEDAAHLTAMLMPLAAPQPSGTPGDCGGTPGSARSCGVHDCAHDGADPREHGTRMWDALIEASRRLTGTDLLPTSHGTRPRVGVTIDLDALRTGRGTGQLDTGQTLSAAAVRQLACDADILPFVLGSASQILDVGRTSRLVTLALWLSLIARDRHCAFPGCSRPPIACDAHHITHWVQGGHTALANLVMLCRTHHTLIHTTPWQVRLHPHDHRPEFLPPARLDPRQTPLRQRPLRE